MVATWALANKASLQGFVTQRFVIFGKKWSNAANNSLITSRCCKISCGASMTRRRLNHNSESGQFHNDTTFIHPFFRETRKKIHLARKTVQSITFPVRFCLVIQLIFNNAIQSGRKTGEFVWLVEDPKSHWSQNAFRAIISDVPFPQKSIPSRFLGALYFLIH